MCVKNMIMIVKNGDNDMMNDNDCDENMRWM